MNRVGNSSSEGDPLNVNAPRPSEISNDGQRTTHCGPLAAEHGQIPKIQNPKSQTGPISKIENPKSKIAPAFTLIELMIVMGIVAIIMTTGVPAFVHAMRKEGLRKAVSDMVEGCSHARAQAILHGLPTELVIRAEDGSITVRPMQFRKSDEDSGSVGPEPGGPSTAITTFKANLPEDIAIKLLYVNFQDQMEYSEARVRFFPNGTCDEFTVILSSPTAEQEVTLDVITGLADVKVIR
jgi:prepilin-type N-terminal cleavage/methylation domain-containing protein